MRAGGLLMLLLASFAIGAGAERLENFTFRDHLVDVACRHGLADGLRLVSEGGSARSPKFLAQVLSPGCNCRGYVWTGPARTEAVFDTGEHP